MTSPTGHPEGSVPPTGRRNPMSPERVRTMDFGRTPLGRRGLNEDEVRLFLARVSEDMAASAAEKADLRSEVARLRNYYRDRGTNIEGDGAARRPPAPQPVVTDPARQNLAAINLMSRAQQAADAQVAQAEEYCRRLVHQAREYYDQVLREATQQANDAAARLAATYDAAGDSVERELLEQRIAWLRTFAEVTQVQLRAVLEALTQEVDKLGDLPVPSGPPARLGE